MLPSFLPPLQTPEASVANDSVRKGVPLLVFADDWGRHPSSCQHLIRELLSRHRVAWVNTIGTRAPRLDMETLRRGFGKFRQWFRGDTKGRESLPAGLTVHNPRMWPWFTRKCDRRINRTLLRRALGRIIEELAEPPVAITTLPIVADLMGELEVSRWVYYGVDDFSQWPGLDRATLGRMERIVLERADVCIAVSEVLQRRFASFGRDSTLLTHGVNLAFWANHAKSSLLEGFDSPRILFWGVIDQRMDVHFVRALAERMTAGSIVLAGPEQQPPPELRRLSRVHHLGPIPFAELPGIAHCADVLIMPYADLPVTRAMQPLKLKEYLATGLPVVVRDLPANRAWGDCLDIAADPEAFAVQVLERVESGIPAEQQMARTKLQAESWSAKASQLERLLVPLPSSRE